MPLSIQNDNAADFMKYVSPIRREDDFKYTYEVKCLWVEICRYVYSFFNKEEITNKKIFESLLEDRNWNTIRSILYKDSDYGKLLIATMSAMLNQEGFEGMCKWNLESKLNGSFKMAGTFEVQVVSHRSVNSQEVMDYSLKKLNINRDPDYHPQANAEDYEGYPYLHSSQLAQTDWELFPKQ